jgi:hypothetical protein
MRKTKESCGVWVRPVFSAVRGMISDARADTCSADATEV